MTTNRYVRWQNRIADRVGVRDESVARIYQATNGRGLSGSANPEQFSDWVKRIEKATAHLGLAARGQDGLLVRRGSPWVSRWSDQWDELDRASAAESAGWQALADAVETAPEDPSAWTAALEAIAIATEEESEVMVVLTQGDAW